MDLSTSMYYTFSTIAQVLAAFIALSGVFIIYKLPYIRNALVFQAEEFLKVTTQIKYGKSEQLVNKEVIEGFIRRLIESGDYKAIQEQMVNILHLDLSFNSAYKIQFVLLNDMKKQFFYINMERKIILLFSKISLLVAIITILYSIYMLSIIHKSICIHLERSFNLGYLGLVICIIFMTWAILLSLRDVKTIKS